jgi:trk system potassium uptake protein TrkA
MKSYAVIGLGRFGCSLAENLDNLGCEVMAIDKSAEKVQHMADSVTRAVVGDSTDKEVLRTLGVQNCDCAIVAIGNHLSAAVLTILNLQELGVPKIVGKARDEACSRVMSKMGVHRIVSPEQDVAARLAHSLCSPNVLDYIELSDEYGIIEVPAPRDWIDMSIRKLNVRARLGVNIIAVKKGEEVNVSPNADYVIRHGDVLVVLGDYAALNAVEKL